MGYKTIAMLRLSDDEGFNDYYRTRIKEE